MGQKKGVFQEGQRPQHGPVKRVLEKPALGSSSTLPPSCWVALDNSLNLSGPLCLWVSLPRSQWRLGLSALTSCSLRFGWANHFHPTLGKAGLLWPQGGVKQQQRL